MQVLITGGCGFIGLEAARALRAKGHAVRLLSSSRSGECDGFPVVRGDVRNGDTLEAAATGIEAAVIAHQFPGFPIERPSTHDTFQEVDAQGTHNVLHALKAHGDPQSLVYLSGAAVHEDRAGLHPGIDAKLAAERSVRDSGIPWTILRASIVYGPGDHYFSQLAGMIEAGPIVPVFGDGRALAEPIHLEDLAAAIAAAVESPEGLLYACGPNALSVNATLDLLMQARKRRRRVLHLPLPAINAVAALMELLPAPPLTRGLIAFTQFDNTARGRNADRPFGLTFRSVDEGVLQVYRHNPS